MSELSAAAAEVTPTVQYERRNTAATDRAYQLYELLIRIARNSLKLGLRNRQTTPEWRSDAIREFI
jgi:hypothetical protein